MKRAWTGLLLALLLPPTAVTAGDIRKWVDAEGRVHFGDDAAAPGRSETVRPSRGNFLGGVRPGAAVGADDAPRSWTHAARSEILPATSGAGPARASASPPAIAAVPATSAPAVASAAGPASVTRMADAGSPDCVPIEYKKISATTGQIVRMRRLPCQPGVAPVEVGPY